MKLGIIDRTKVDADLELNAICARALELCGPGYRSLSDPATLTEPGRPILWDVLGPHGMVALCQQWPDQIPAERMAELLAMVLRNARPVRPS